MKLRIKERRDERRWSQEELAARSGFDVSQISRWETAERFPSLPQVEALAATFGVRPRDLLDDVARVPVVGTVGAGQRVIAIDDYPAGEARKALPCPENLDPRSTVAVEVVGDSMLPIGEGWFLFYKERGGTSDVLGRLCVVEVAEDGAQMIKRVRPGYDDGRFNLISTNASPIENVALNWAAPVLDMKPPEWGSEITSEPVFEDVPVKRKRGRPRKARAA